MKQSISNVKKPVFKTRKAPIREVEKDILNMCQICGQQKGFITKTCHSCPDTTHSSQVARESMNHDLVEENDYLRKVVLFALIGGISIGITLANSYLMNLPTLNP